MKKTLFLALLGLPLILTACTKISKTASINSSNCVSTIGLAPVDLTGKSISVLENGCSGAEYCSFRDGNTTVHNNTKCTYTKTGDNTAQIISVYNGHKTIYNLIFTSATEGVTSDKSASFWINNES